ncbi:iron ABC transporter permease [Amycolatopsis sp. NPDC006131]|uniref:ABC transporter permease n=1 Tax=Amycolatopsis sp. NPDC006131 TaxID=3156731 RepID=UPI0033AF7A15
MARARWQAGIVVLRLSAAVVGLLALVPLGFVVAYTISTGWGEVERLVFRLRTVELLWNTIRLVGGSVLLCAMIGVGAAWLVERTTLPGRKVWHVLLVAPLAVPAFVNSYGWVSVLPEASGYLGALLIVTLSYFPLVYLPVVAAFRGLDPALEESARTLGLGPAATFWRIVLPQLRPALLGGCLLVALHLLAEFGALQMLRFPTFTTAIYDQFQSSYNGPAANMLAGVLVLLCLLLLLGELRLRGRARHARVGAGSARRVTPTSLRGGTAPVLLALAVLVGLALGVPVGSLVFWLVTGASTGVPVSDLSSAAAASLGLGGVAGVVTVVVAIPVAWLAVRHRGWWVTLVERCTYFGSTLPGIVVALALVTVSIRMVPAIYQTTALLIVAYTILFLPRAVVNVRSALAQVPPELEDVAHGLGLSRLATLRRVTLPLIAPGLGAGAALVFIAAATELTATLLLSPIGTRTLATEFWSYSSSVEYGAAAPYAAVMVLLSVPATYLLTRDPRRATEG